MRVLCVIMLTFFVSCASKVSEAERNVDFKIVVQQVLTRSKLQRYLAPPDSGVLLFHFGELPIYNGSPVTKPNFSIIGPYNQSITYSTNLAEETNNVVIVVDRLIIDNDSAEVNLSISKMRLMGLFRLVRGPGNTWLVISASISQS